MHQILKIKIIGAYDEKDNKKFGTSSKKIFFYKPGKTERFSLRVGLIEFNEGITLSYAQTFDKSNNYYPFIPFAYLLKKMKKNLLYYILLQKLKKMKNFQDSILLFMVVSLMHFMILL